MNKLLKIRREFGEPFVDVVRGYAEMGYSRKLTAASIGLSLRYFMKLIKRFNLGKHFKPIREMRPECRGVGCPTKTPYPKGSTNWDLKGKNKYTNEEILAEVRKYDVYGQFFDKAKMSMGTLVLRFGGFRNARNIAEGRGTAP